MILNDLDFEQELEEVHPYDKALDQCVHTILDHIRQGNLSFEVLRHWVDLNCSSPVNSPEILELRFLESIREVTNDTE